MNKFREVSRDDLNEEIETTKRLSQRRSTDSEPQTTAPIDEASKTASREAEEKVAEAAEAVQRLYVNEAFSGPFDLGDSLTSLHATMEKAWDQTSVTNEKVATYLKDNFNMSLTGQQVSSLRLTADYFPKNSRNQNFSFKDYEKACKIDQKSKTPLGGKKLAEAMKSGEFELPYESAAKGDRKPTLTISVKLDSIADINLDDPTSVKSDTAISANGKKIEKTEDWMLAAAYEAIDAIKKQFSIE